MAFFLFAGGLVMLAVVLYLAWEDSKKVRVQFIRAVLDSDLSPVAKMKLFNDKDTWK